MKRLFAALIALLLVAPIAAESKIRVAMLLPGSISDQSYNAAAYEGIQLAAKKYGLEFQISESIPFAGIEEAMLNYAREGYDVIYGHGFQFAEPAFKLHKQFPKSWFVVHGIDDGAPPNLVSIQNRYGELGYVAGVLAGATTKTGVISNVSSMVVPIIEKLNQGFADGAKSVRPDVKVLTGVVGSWSDAAKAKEITATHIESGADVIFATGNESAVGNYQAAKEAGKMAIASSFDSASVAPDTIMTTALIKIQTNLDLILGKVVDGTIEAKNYSLGFAEDTLGLAPYRRFDSKLSAEVKQKVANAIADIKSGKIKR